MARLVGEGQRGIAVVAQAAMLASGFAGLGYQIVWTQQAALWLGHEAAAVLAVVTAFFGGLALGAWALGQRVERSARPERWYAACEMLTALWSLVLAALLAPASGWLLNVIGPQPTPAWQWAVAFGGTFALLLPATAAMGATLPAMERVCARLGRVDRHSDAYGETYGDSGDSGDSNGIDARGSRSLATLYACNTFGAVLGVLAAAFWLVPQFGLAATAAVCAALNVGCAAAALRLAAAPGQHALSTGAPLTAAPTAPGPADQRRTLVLLAATGLLGIGYEVLVVRVLSQVSEDTVYTFALLLAVYLVGTASGAAAYARWLRSAWLPLSLGENGVRAGMARRLQAQPLTPTLSPQGRGSKSMRDWLLCLLAAACLFGGLCLHAAEVIRQAVQHAFGLGMATALAAEAALALVAFGLPTLVMGALFSHLATQARGAGTGFGRVLAVNTLGAAAAPPLFGVWLAPALGPGLALLAVVAGYLALLSPRAWAWSWPWSWPGPGHPALAAGSAAVVAATVAAALWAPPLAFVDVPEGGRIASYREGTMAAVSVVEDAAGVARLRIDNRQQEGNSSSLFADARQALLPLLLHPSPRRALFLGLGTGMTARSAAEDASLQVDAVELLPEVIDASAQFAIAFDHRPAPPNLHLIAADARRFVRAGTQHYDLIVADNFHPARSGSGALYTVEHFRAVRDRLAPGGVFCQWLPLHQLDLPTLRSIVQSFIAVHPGGWATLATNSLETPVLGLVARADGQRFDLRQLRARLAANTLPQRLADFGIADDFALLGGFIAGPKALATLAGDAPLNTDDHPVVAYRAPRITYAADSLPRDRLLALLRQTALTPTELVEPGSDADPAWPQRLAAYWAARDRFIEAGRAVRPSADVRDMLAQVREPLLAVLRTSPDFRPAYDPLLRMAASLQRRDAAGARALLTALAQAQPARPEAVQALSELADAPR